MAAAQAADDQRNRAERLCTSEDATRARTEHTLGLAVAEQQFRAVVDAGSLYKMKPNYVLYNHFGYKEDWSRRIAQKRERRFYNYCFVSVCLSFVVGLVIGVVIVGTPPTKHNFVPRKLVKINSSREIRSRSLNSQKFSTNFKSANDFDISVNDRGKFATVSFTDAAVGPHSYKQDVYPSTLTQDTREVLEDKQLARRAGSAAGALNEADYAPSDLTVLYDNIYWGPQVENSMPQGYGDNAAELWEKYVGQSEAVKMEVGCGRMQNRLITFRDGVQACVRYRQNTDQIQGEIFSFYVARLLNLTNLAPSVVKVVDLKDKLWSSVRGEVAAAQWSNNRAVVLTQYVPSLEAAAIPSIFKPSTRHLNKNDVLNISMKENETVHISKQTFIDKLKIKNIKTSTESISRQFEHIEVKLNKKTIKSFVELAQWSDLIVFDYLTANLDRIVNNLFNYQWNINIMDGPAHNLARKMDSGLLLFLDNESGLLHGYRLLKKYNAYHALMLDNLCVFRKRTVDALRSLHRQSVRDQLSDIFHRKNNAVIRDILPPLPEKNAKVLHERIGKILSQVDKCEQSFANSIR